MPSNRRTERPGQQLAAQANTEIGFAAGQPALDPIDFRPQIMLFAEVVDALRTAIDDDRHMFIGRCRQSLALARTAPLQGKAALGQAARGAVVTLADRVIDQEHGFFHLRI